MIRCRWRRVIIVDFEIDVSILLNGGPWCSSVKITYWATKALHMPCPIFRLHLRYLRVSQKKSIPRGNAKIYEIVLKVWMYVLYKIRTLMRPPSQEHRHRCSVPHVSPGSYIHPWASVNQTRPSLLDSPLYGETQPQLSPQNHGVRHSTQSRT